MATNQLASYARSLSVTSLMGKIAQFGLRQCRGWFYQAKASERCTYVDEIYDDHWRPPNFLQNVAKNLTSANFQALKAASRRFTKGEFNLLGSGWVAVRYGQPCLGFGDMVYPPAHRPHTPDRLVERLSPGNRSRAQRIRSRIDTAYEPIDWQLDFRSGYRWREDRWAALMPFGHKPAVDIKVPWELGRLQHLPVLGLAWQCAQASKPGFEPAEVYEAAYKNQLLDFLAANPPGFGVNWACTMDVAIRTANLVIASWVFAGSKCDRDLGVHHELSSALIAHGRHIFTNLEWAAEFRGNHYLANIAGLAFVAAYLPSNPETDLWMTFSIDQLTRETAQQFNNDGSNFEGSVCYHRLSAEMVMSATALILGLTPERRDAILGANLNNWPKGPLRPGKSLSWHPDHGPFPGSHFSALERMATFTAKVSKPNKLVVQIGDNDSGRFVKIGLGHLTPDGDEVHLDHNGFVAMAAGLFARPEFEDIAEPEHAVERSFIQSLSGGVILPAAVDYPSFASPSAPHHPNSEDNPKQCETVLDLSSYAVLANIKTHAYPDFGIYIWRSERLFLSIRCGPLGQNGRGGHDHNDQLAIELNIDGEDWVADPGSYVYTASHKHRDAYRSVHAHAAPKFGAHEPGRFNLGMFRLGNQAQAQCLSFSEQSFLGVHFGFSQAVYRALKITDTAITLRDSFGAPPVWTTPADETLSVHSPVELRKRLGLTIPFSPGYGLID
ncbi:MAG: alginate lyase family protein [Rhodospirillaceae bacterium]|nr:alginate lyase family protein [Rhodospirillaceae bacterium]